MIVSASHRLATSMFHFLGATVRQDEMRWLYTVSPVQLHDLRNRLTVVKGMAQLLARQIARADWQRDRVVYRVDCLQSAISDLEVVVQALARDHIERQPDTTGDVFPEQY